MSQHKSKWVIKWLLQSSILVDVVDITCYFILWQQSTNKPCHIVHVISMNES